MNTVHLHVKLEESEMARKTALVKVSGDLCTSTSFIALIRDIAKEYFTVICVGGGSQINAAFQQHGFSVGVHGPLGRETTTFQERQVARDVLENNQAELQDVFARMNIVA